MKKNGMEIGSGVASGVSAGVAGMKTEVGSCMVRIEERKRVVSSEGLSTSLQSPAIDGMEYGAIAGALAQ